VQRDRAKSVLAICAVESERLKVLKRSLRFLNCCELRSYESLADLFQLIVSDGNTPKPANPVLAFRPGFHPLIDVPSTRGPHQQHAPHWIAQWPRHPNEQHAKGSCAFKSDGLFPAESFSLHNAEPMSNSG
jgi:hypothetical protein